MKVVVMTNVELGWDCVTGVYADLKTAIHKHYMYMGEPVPDKPLSVLKAEIENDGYVFFEREVEVL